MSSTDKMRSSHALSPETQQVFQAINGLSTDEKLALLYYIYEKMGDSITPAAPQAAEPEIAPLLLGNFYNLSAQEQLTIMRGIVNGDDTQYSDAYGALTANNQLVVWYIWAVEMGKRVVDLPESYQPTEAINNTLAQIEGLDFEQQITVLRDVVSQMGYSNVKPIPTQSEVGKTSSL